MISQDQSWSHRASLTTSRTVVKAQVLWLKTTCHWSLSRTKFQDLFQPIKEQAKVSSNQILFNHTSARCRTSKCHSVLPRTVRQISRRHRRLRNATAKTIIKNRMTTPWTACKTSLTAMSTLTTAWMMEQSKASLKSRAVLTSITREEELRLKFYTARRTQVNKCNRL